MTIPEQLVEIYKKETWHKERLTDEQALFYHKKHYENGDISVYEKDGEVLGYFERYFLFNTCFLWNVYVKENYRRTEVFKELCKRFFKTLPKHITKIIAEKKKTGKVVEKKIRR